MLYYAMLLVICLVVGLVMLWLWTEAMTIRKKGRKKPGRNLKPTPTDHLKGAVTKTTINNGTMSWGGESRLAPKHPARTNAAPADKSSYWDWKGNGQRPAKNQSFHAYPDGSKSESEFWNYLVPSDRPGHGTGVKPGGHGTSSKRV